MRTHGNRKLSEVLSLQGKVELFVSKGAPKLILGDEICLGGMGKTYNSCEISFEDNQLISQQVLYNIIVNQGKDKVVESLGTGLLNPIGRMAIGDRGTIPSDSTIPKVPQDTFTTLYNEVYRADYDARVVNTGTPTVHEIKFIKTFNATDVPIASFSNQTSPVINEVGLITYDPTIQPLPRDPVAAPDSPQTDEKLFSIRTFKSVPFEAADEISVTIRYTIFIQ